MFLFNDQRDEYTVYSTQDQAIDKENSDLEKYAEDADAEHLTFLEGSDPVAFICRPMSFRAQRQLTKLYTSSGDIEQNTDVHFGIAELSFLSSVVRIGTKQDLPNELVGILAKGRVEGLLPKRAIEFFAPLVIMDVGGRCGMVSISNKKK